MSVKCWICGRTEEEAQAEFIKRILEDEKISEETKEIIKQGKYILKHGLEEGFEIQIRKEDNSDERLWISACLICDALVNGATMIAIDIIEDDHKALFDWFYKRP